MVKTPSVWLKEELSKKGAELLDIYSFRDHDVIRVRLPLANKVILYKTKRKVSSLTSREEAAKLADEILGSK